MPIRQSHGAALAFASVRHARPLPGPSPLHVSSSSFGAGSHSLTRAPSAPRAECSTRRQDPPPRAGTRRFRTAATDRCALLCRQATPARQYSWLSRQRRRAALCGPPRDRRSPASVGAVARSIRTQVQPSVGAPAGSQQERRQSPPLPPASCAPKGSASTLSAGPAVPSASRAGRSSADCSDKHRARESQGLRVARHTHEPRERVEW